MGSLEVAPNPLDNVELSDKEHVKLALAYLVRDISDIKRFFQKNQLDIDMYASDFAGTNPGGILKVRKQVNKPIIVQAILATWDPTTIIAFLTIGDRQIPLVPGSGFFNATGVTIQVQRDDEIFLTVTAGKECYLEVMGTADSRKIDRS